MVLKARPKVFKTLLAIALTTSLCPIVPARAEESTSDVAESIPNEASCSSSADSADKCGESATLSDTQFSNEQQSAFDIKSPAEAESQGNAIQAEYLNDTIVDWTKCGECEWMIDAEGCLIIRPRNNQDSGSLENWSKVPWREKASSIKSIRFTGTVSVPNAAGMFRYCNNAQSIDLNGLDTSCTTDMSFMFSDFGTNEMASVDLSPIDTSSVTDMTEMFSRSHIKQISLSLCNLERVAYTNNMFEYCSAESIDMGDSHFASLIDASEMFKNCSKLKSISLSSFTAPNLQLMPSLFEGCKSIQEIDLSAIGNNCVKSMERAFRDCDSLRTISFGNFKSNKRISLWGAFLNDVSLRTISMSSLSSQPIDDICYAFKNCPSLEYVDISGIKTDDSTDTTYSFDSEKCPLSSFTLKVGNSFSFHTRQGNDVGPTASNDGLLTGRWVDIVSGKTFKRGGDITGPGTFVQQKELSRYTVSVDTQDETFANQAITKAIRSELVEGKDYTVNYSNNTNVGAAALTAKGINACAGQSVSFEFNIVQADPQFQAPSQIAVAYGQKTSSVALPEGFSWQSDDSHFTRPGTSDYLLTYTPQDSNYKTVRDIPISVTTSYLLTPDLFEIDLATETYDGTPKTKSILNPFVHEGEDYTVEYNDNVNAGNATITLTGINRYAGQHVNFNFNINKAVPNYEQSFTFDAKCDEILGDITLPEGYSWQASQETPVGSAGQHTFFVSYTPQDTNNYEVVRDIPVIINVTKYQLDKSQFNVDTQNVTYTGSSILKQVNATVPDLEQGRDFHVMQTNNVYAGTATIEIQGQGKYTGILRYSFTILKADPTYSTPDIINTTSGLKLKQVPLPHGFSWQKPETAINNPGDYTFLTSFTPQDIANNNVIRNIPVIVRATTTLSASMFTLTQSSFTYSGSAIEPAVRSAVVPEGSYTVEYRDNVCAGQAVAIITGAGGYTGSCELRFAIEKADPAYEAPGALIGTFGKTLSSITLPEGFSWQDDPNTPIDWRGNKEFELAYTPADAANYNTVQNIPITVFVEYDSVNIPTIAPFIYSGQLHKPTFDDDQRITVLANNGGTDAGTYTATVALANPAFDRWVDGTVDPKTISYNISPADISSASIENIPDTVLEDGKAEPAVSALFNENPLQSGKDFTVSYENNTRVGTGNVVISGTGNFTGITRLSFRVGLADISSCKPIIYDTPLVYQGEPVTPHVYLGKPNSGVTLHEGIDYEVAYSDNNAIGKATATLRGIGDYVGSTAIAFEIVNKLDLASTSCQVDNCAFYTGSPITQPVSVYRGHSSLSEGVDYTVTYENNINPGCATAVIHGIGNYTGEARCNFSIIRKADYSLSDGNAKLSLSSGNRYVYSYATNTFLYTGSSVTPQATVYLQVGSTSMKLVEDIDYTVSYSNNNAIGTGFVTVTGINGLEGSVSGSFTISKTLPVSALNLSSVWDFDQIDYDLSSESPVKPKLIPSPYFVEGADYDLTYKDCNKIGTGFVSINGRGRYTGSVTLPVSIVAKHSRLLLQDCTADTIPNQIYTGSPIQPSITMRNANGRILDNGLEYEPQFYNNVNVGTANVTVAQGAGFTTYDGYLQTSFNILPANIANTEINPIPDQPLQKQAPKPDPRLTFNGKLLQENIDYETAYTNNDKLGTATITITGKGNFTGQTTTTFNVVEYEMPYDDVLTEFESKAVKWNDDKGQILKFSLPKGGAPFFIVNSVQGSYNAKAAILDGQANEIYSFDLQSQKQYGAMALPAGDYYLKIWGDTYNQAGVCVLHYGNGLYGQNDNCIYEKESNCPSNDQTIADVATPVNLNSRFIGTAYMPPMSDDTDYYSFTLDKPMTIELNFSANQSFRFCLVDDSGKTIEKADGDGYLSKMTYWDKEATVNMKCGVLKPGTYYVKVNAAMKEAIGSTYYCDIKTIASHWVSSNGRWWWQETDGSYPISCWQTIDGKCYHFDSSGYMQTGWLKVDGNWYWLGNDGAARTGWQQINGAWYWFENDGRMATGWQTIDAKRYLFAGSGSMMTGWQQTGGSWYYLGGSGAMATGWQSIGGTWYWFNESGIMATGWFKPDESYYYANSSGAMQSNCWVGDYYLTSSGMMAANTWIGSYYVGPDGKWMR